MGVYQPKHANVPYGLHIPYNKGYDARSRANAPKAEQNGASGQFRRPDGKTIALWITDITADFSLSGTQGQSRMLREFFPHSFNDVTLQITGNVASTQEYNRLALFVREHQWGALQEINGGGKATQTIDFHLYNTYAGGRTPGRGRTIKGPHRPWSVSGYISSIGAGAVRHEIAPEFSINFIVATSQLSGNTGIWSDSLASGSSLKTFLQIIGTSKQAKTGRGFVQDPIAPPRPPAATPSPSAPYLTWSTAAGTTLLGRTLLGGIR